MWRKSLEPLVVSLLFNAVLLFPPTARFLQRLFPETLDHRSQGTHGALQNKYKPLAFSALSPRQSSCIQRQTTYTTAPSKTKGRIIQFPSSLSRFPRHTSYTQHRPHGVRRLVKAKQSQSSTRMAPRPGEERDKENTKKEASAVGLVKPATSSSPAPPWLSTIRASTTSEQRLGKEEFEKTVPSDTRKLTDYLNQVSIDFKKCK